MWPEGWRREFRAPKLEQMKQTRTLLWRLRQVVLFWARRRPRKDSRKGLVMALSAARRAWLDIGKLISGSQRLHPTWTWAVVP